MATASKAPAASTPKHTMAAAPTPSPRPMGRPSSLMSPSIKTPASLHGHSHNLSTSSHPSSTPLAAPAFGEDALAYNSPAAALLASIASQGLTPNGHDVLGISTKGVSTKEDPRGRQGHIEEETLRNLQDVQRTLKTRLAGRAICREGVQRIAQHSNLTFAWLDDNNLSIAGNCVDLEIVFDDAQRDSVRDVVLKINTSGVEEHKNDASAVLRHDLDPSTYDTSTAPWKSLEAFSANLASLAHLDHLSNGLNCFEAVDGLYYSFQRIWAEEKKRLQSKHVLGRICEGNVGRPAMHKKRKLGLSLDYWVENRRTRETEPKVEGADAMDVDELDAQVADDDQSSLTWLARIGCDIGYPSIRVSKDWLGEEIFADTDAHDAGDQAENEIHKPIWLDPDATLVTTPMEKDDTDDPIIKQAGAGISSLPRPPGIRFTVDLEPAVLLTNSAFSTMFTTGVTIVVDYAKATTYRQALDDFASPQSSSQSHQGMDTQSGNAREAQKRWRRNLTVYDNSGLAKQARHSYALYCSIPVGAYSMQSFSFGHPRQLAEALPLLRQYALLWSIMRKLSPLSDGSVVEESASKNELDGCQRPKKSRAPQKKSNISAQRARVDALLGGTGLLGEAGIPVDVSLSETLTDPPKPKLDLIFPLSTGTCGGAPDGSVKLDDNLTRMLVGSAVKQPDLMTVAIEIEINGKIVVSSASVTRRLKGHGIRSIDLEILRKMANVLAISEDLGVLVQWILMRQSFNA